MDFLIALFWLLLFISVTGAGVYAHTSFKDATSWRTRMGAPQLTGAEALVPTIAFFAQGLMIFGVASVIVLMLSALIMRMTGGI